MDLVERARRRREPSAAERRSARSSPACSSTRDAEHWEPEPGDRGRARRSCSSSASTGPARPRRSASSPPRARERPARSSSRPPTRSAPRPSTSSGSGPQRAGRAEIVAHAPNADPARRRVRRARRGRRPARPTCVIADTAGRLHTKSNLMDELSKVRRIIDKRLPGAEPETLFVLDATTGQNGLAQAKAFHEAVGLTGRRAHQARLDGQGRHRVRDRGRRSTSRSGSSGWGRRSSDLLPFDPEAFVDGAVRLSRATAGRSSRRTAGLGRPDRASPAASPRSAATSASEHRGSRLRRAARRAAPGTAARAQPDHLGQQPADERRDQLGEHRRHAERRVDAPELAVGDERLADGRPR